MLGRVGLSVGEAGRRSVNWMDKRSEGERSDVFVCWGFYFLVVYRFTLGRGTANNAHIVVLYH